MRNKLLAMIYAVMTSLLLAFAAEAADAPKPDPASLLNETLKISHLPLRLDGDRLTGLGAAYLKTRAAAARFVFIGEEHGVADIADAVRGYFTDLNALGYRHFAVEADPHMTPKLEAMLRSADKDALKSFLTTDNRILAIPFFNWRSEAALARAVITANPTSPALWGLDQVFIGAAPVLFQDIATGARNAEARTLAGSLASRSKEDLQLLGKIDIAELERLRALLSAREDAALAKLTDDMILSARIYQPFVSGKGLSVYAANLERENLMKRTFLAHYRAATAREGAPPKVFFKFGTTHMAQGLSSTHVPTLGNFAANLAFAEGASSFHLVVVCGPGTVVANLMGESLKCDKYFSDNFGAFDAFVDKQGLTLFDLAPLKDKPKRWAQLPESTRNTLWAYDAMLVVSSGKPAELFK